MASSSAILALKVGIIAVVLAVLVAPSAGRCRSAPPPPPPPTPSPPPPAPIPPPPPPPALPAPAPAPASVELCPACDPECGPECTDAVHKSCRDICFNICDKCTTAARNGCESDPKCDCPRHCSDILKAKCSRSCDSRGCDACMGEGYYQCRIKCTNCPMVPCDHK